MIARLYPKAAFAFSYNPTGKEMVYINSTVPPEDTNPKTQKHKISWNQPQSSTIKMYQYVILQVAKNTIIFTKNPPTTNDVFSDLQQTHFMWHVFWSQPPSFHIRLQKENKGTTKNSTIYLYEYTHHRFQDFNSVFALDARFVY